MSKPVKTGGGKEGLRVQGGYVVQVFRKGKLDEIVCAEDKPQPRPAK